MGDGSPAINLEHNTYRLYADKDGDVHIIASYKWIRLGNIHEEDIVNRIKKAIK